MDAGFVPKGRRSRYRFGDRNRASGGFGHETTQGLKLLGRYGAAGAGNPAKGHGDLL
jgi:hypothetical protein